MTKSTDHARTLLPERAVAEKYGVCVRTIMRWGDDPSLGFPPVVIIRKRRYRDLAALEAWDAAHRERELLTCQRRLHHESVALANECRGRVGSANPGS
jgi:hypothetical protein